MSKVIEILNPDEYQKFKISHKRAVIFYSAEWCKACKDIEPLYSRIANRYAKRIALAHVDIDVCGLDFTAIPVFVSFHKGEQLDSMEGASDAGLRVFIKHAIEYNGDKNSNKNHDMVAPTPKEDHYHAVPKHDSDDPDLKPVPKHNNHKASPAPKEEHRKNSKAVLHEGHRKVSPALKEEDRKNPKVMLHEDRVFSPPLKEDKVLPITKEDNHEVSSPTINYDNYKNSKVTPILKEEPINHQHKDNKKKPDIIKLIAPK